MDQSDEFVALGLVQHTEQVDDGGRPEAVGNGLVLSGVRQQLLKDGEPVLQAVGHQFRVEVGIKKI
jgi:hypothetical protein